jgi:predicted lysophospholipase L1 biosynthesis ABC-type transport system permease subunit
MNQNSSYEKDIQSIRALMERSVKFLSLSGLSGVLAGVYALIGATAAYFIIYQQQTPFDYHDQGVKEVTITFRLLLIAVTVLLVSLLTGYILAYRKSKKLGAQLWDATSKRLVINLAVPLVAGGIFILILLMRGYYQVAAPASLIFYGLALINASANLFDEVRYLGYIEIVLGLVAAVFVGYGLYFWAFGFGVLHVVYGLVMYKKYDS